MFKRDGWTFSLGVNRNHGETKWWVTAWPDGEPKRAATSTVKTASIIMAAVLEAFAEARQKAESAGTRAWTHL